MNKYEHKRGSMRKALIVTSSVLVGAAIILAGGAVWLGYLTVGIKDPSQKVVIRTQVCGDDVIAKYNEAAKSDSVDTYKTKLKAVFEDVTGRESNAEDPTCAFIVYRYHLIENQKDQINASVETLKRLSDEGAYPSNKLTDTQSIEQIEGRASIVDGNIESSSAGGAG